MKAPLIPLNEDFKWKLLSEILNFFDMRSCRQILTRRGILPLHKSVPAIKILLLSMFFSCEISFSIRELKERESLRTFMQKRLPKKAWKTKNTNGATQLTEDSSSA